MMRAHGRKWNRLQIHPWLLAILTLVVSSLVGGAWYVLAKVGAAEALADWRIRSAIAAALVLGSIALTGIIAWLLWQRAGKIHFRALYRSEALLRAEAEHHSTILKAIGDAVIATDARGRVELLNPVAEALTGWRQEEARGRALREIFRIVDAHSREPSQDPVAQVLRADTAVGLAKDTLLIARDGTEYQIADSAAPIRDPGGAVSGVVLVFRDVTESCRMRQELETRETRYRELIESTAAIAWEYDIGADRWTYVAPQVESILGWRPKDWSNLAFWIDNLHPDDRETAYSHCMACTAKGENHLLEYRFRSKGGDYVWLRDVVVVEMANGEPARLRGILIDITERKRAEEALQERERYYRSLIHALHEDIIVIDRDYRIIDINNSALRTLGRTREEAIGRRCHALSHGLDRPCHEHDGGCKACGLLRVFDTGQPCNLYHEHVDRAGGRRHIDLLCSPLKDEHGRVTHMVEAARDVTDLFAAQHAVAASEAKLRNILDNCADAIFIMDQEGRFAYLNKCAAALVGYSEEALASMRFLDIAAESEIENHQALYARLLQSGQACNEMELRRQDGSRVAVEINAVRLPNGLVAANCRDITVRRGAEEERRRLMSAIAHTTEAIVITDIEGTIEYVNPAFEHATGYTQEEARGQNPRILKSGEQDASFYEHLWQTILAGDTWRGRMTNRRKDGTFYVEEAVISPVLDTTGRIVNFVAVKRDISADLRIEERLRQAQKMEAIGTLAGGIAHDFNNILFPIIGMSELLLEDLPPEGPEYDNVREILTAGKRGSELVKQILAFSRQSEDKKMPMRLQPILKEAIKLVRATIPSNIAIVERIQPDCGRVMANATQIHQVAMNLITNAFHAVELTGGRIAIGLAEVAVEGEEGLHRALEPGRYARLTVSDTGNGIDPAVKDKIFEPYFTTKSQNKGTGLGLSMVYGIVKQHKGDITVYSEIGEGAAFNVYLPLMTRADSPRGKESLEKIQSGSERILLVDDEAAIARLERQMLERLGYRVTSRVSSLEALEAFKAAPSAYDLVITDMTMPNMTGDGLAKALKAIRADIPVIICTGFSERIDPAAAAEMGIRAFLMKPVAYSQLARVVRNVLDGGGPAH